METGLQRHRHREEGQFIAGIEAELLLELILLVARPGETVVNNFELGFFVRPQVKQLAEEKNHRQTAQFKIAAEDAQPFPIVEVKR